LIQKPFEYTVLLLWYLLWFVSLAINPRNPILNCLLLRCCLQEDDEIVTLQVGKTVWEQAPRQMRVELWMSSLQRRGVGVAAAAKYEDMLLTVRVMCDVACLLLGACVLVWPAGVGGSSKVRGHAAHGAQASKRQSRGGLQQHATAGLLLEIGCRAAAAPAYRPLQHHMPSTCVHARVSLHVTSKQLPRGATAGYCTRQLKATVAKLMAHLVLLFLLRCCCCRAYRLQPVSDEAVNDIEKDIARTFPNTRRFAAQEGQEALRRVLHAYAAYDPEVHSCMQHIHSTQLYAAYTQYAAVRSIYTVRSFTQHIRRMQLFSAYRYAGV
jgi:hypothetical protein